MSPIKLEKDPEGGWIVTQVNLDSGCLAPDEALGIIAHALYGDGSPHRFLRPLQTTNTKLFPCPHCGNDSSLVTEKASDCDFFRIICDASKGKGCGSSAGYKTSEREAIELWNTREVKSNAITVPSAYSHVADVPEPDWMTADDIRMLADGWLQHDGSECPIPDAKHGEYQIRYRDGTRSSAANDYPAASFHWEHHGSNKDIVAYRLLDKRQPSGTENEGSDQD